MSTLRNLSFSQPTVSESDSLLLALFFAVLIHAIILLGINFTYPKAKKTNNHLEVTLASSPVTKAPKKAKFLAQDNQIGAGKKANRQKKPKQKLASQGNGKKKQAVQRKNQTEIKPKAKQKLVTQLKAEQIIHTSELQHTQTVRKRPKLSVDALQQQISQLGAKIRHSHQNSELSKIKFINSVSTHKYVAAQYMKDWENKIERTGNLNYPKVAREKGFSGTLSMDVGINSDGSIYSIRITKSSGMTALDNAAKNIVRLSAPFAALPVELLKELNVLVIPRVWKFSDETGITTQ